MSEGIQSGIDESPAMAATLSMPYTLTTGRGAGAWLAETARRRLVGSRCAGTGEVTVPPADFCHCGAEETPELVEVAPSGSVTAWTRTVDGAVALVRLDGTSGDLLHRVVGDTKGLTVGSRVGAVWGDGSDPLLALAGFELADVDRGPDPVALADPAEPIAELPYRLELDYQHSYGPYYGRMFDELAAARRIVGTRCPSCRNVLIPARGNCDACFVPTTQVVDVADTGTLQAFSVIHLEFVGQTRKPPYVYAEINLDGSATRLIHNVAGIDMAHAEETLTIGTRVRAVWKEGAPARGTLSDIDHFEPIGD